jgi:YggT family protein
VILAISSLRLHAAEYVEDLSWVYVVALIAYVVTSMFFALGLRIPYSRWSDAVLTFLRDVSEPFLRLLRRILPSFGAIDLSPMVAIIVVYLAGSLVSSAIRG